MLPQLDPLNLALSQRLNLALSQRDRAANDPAQMAALPYGAYIIGRHVWHQKSIKWYTYYICLPMVGTINYIILLFSSCLYRQERPTLGITPQSDLAQAGMALVQARMNTSTGETGKHLHRVLYISLQPARHSRLRVSRITRMDAASVLSHHTSTSHGNSPRSRY